MEEISKKVICINCREFQSYEIKEKKSFCIISGNEIEYTEKVAHCKKCGEEVWVEDIE